MQQQTEDAAGSGVADGGGGRPGAGNGGAWAAFLVCAFLAVGLAGLFASYAAPLPLDRAMAREQALDDALAATRGTDPAAAIEALRSRLGESAEALLPVGGDMAARIARARLDMRIRFAQEAAVVAERTRWLISVVTVMAAAFGVAVLRIGRRG